MGKIKELVIEYMDSISKQEEKLIKGILVKNNIFTLDELENYDDDFIKRRMKEKYAGLFVTDNCIEFYIDGELLEQYKISRELVRNKEDDSITITMSIRRIF